MLESKVVNHLHNVKEKELIGITYYTVNLYTPIHKQSTKMSTTGTSVIAQIHVMQQRFRRVTLKKCNNSSTHASNSNSIQSDATIKNRKKIHAMKQRSREATKKEVNTFRYGFKFKQKVRRCDREHE